jgi:hypothetical protein
MQDPVTIRFRNDCSFFEADDAAKFIREGKTTWHKVEELVGIEPAKPGDCWRSMWYGAGLAGYAICCPKCLRVHAWCSARNCEPKIPWSIVVDGQTHTGTSCRHSGTDSCWTWTGNPEDGTLTASPSLHCDESIGGCGWHGFLTNGVLKHC